MKSLSILLSLTFLSTGLSAIEDTGSQTERNRILQSDCTNPEYERYDKQVSRKRISRLFGPSGSEEVDGPIDTLFCKGGKNCSKLKLTSFTPDLPKEGNQDITKNEPGETYYTPPFSEGKKTCDDNEIVTGVECEGPGCGSVRLQCSRLNRGLYIRDSSSRPANGWATSGSKSKCKKGQYMVGMQCRGSNCSEMKLECAKLQYESRCNDGLNEPTPAPTPTCRNKTLHNGHPWADIDNNKCYDYKKWGWCQKYGSIESYRNIYTANEACCECGGGDRD